MLKHVISYVKVCKLVILRGGSLTLFLLLYRNITLKYVISYDKVKSFRHQICDFSRDIILYDFVHSNISTIFDSANYSWCYVMIRIDTWLSILYLIMGYSTFKLYNSSQPCKKVVIEICCKVFIRSGRDRMFFLFFLDLYSLISINFR